MLISWDGHEGENWDPMKIITTDDPVNLENYAFDNNLIDKDIWKWAKQYKTNVKKTNLMVINLLASKRALCGVKYQFSVRVPSNIKNAYRLNK